MTVQKLKEEVKKLSPQERILFIQYVLATLIDESHDATGTHLSDEWKEELATRSDAYEEGETKTHSWSEIKERLIRKHS
jgi:putative addiction module component (TIGR02574 family)